MIYGQLLGYGKCLKLGVLQQASSSAPKLQPRHFPKNAGDPELQRISLARLRGSTKLTAKLWDINNITQPELPSYQ